ncbi:hypothetical protein MD484_g6182, partial [Candolleomyces efflorescens]
MRDLPSGVPTTLTTPNNTGFATTESTRRHNDMSNDGWTTVNRRRRRAHSLDSASRSEANVTVSIGEEQARAPPVLTNEQSAATAGVGNGDPDDSHSDSSDDSSVRSIVPKPGPSRDKGKGVDLRNYGGINWDSDELDMKAQAVALEQFKKKKSRKDKPSKKSSAPKVAAPIAAPVTTTPRIDSIINNVPRREQSVLPLPSIFHTINPPRAPRRSHEPRDAQEIDQTVAAARPAAQIPSHSGLAVAFQAAKRLNEGKELSSKDSKKKSGKSLRKRKKRSENKEYRRMKKAKYNKKRKARRSRRDPSSSDSSSSSEPSDSSSDSPGPGGGDDSRPPRRRVPQPDGDSSSSESSTSSDSSSDTTTSSESESEDERVPKNILSQMKVFRYDGSQNIRSFVRNVREVVSSLEMNRVPEKYQVEVAARSLEKKAYDYYEQRIANSARNWTIPQMYEALFNHIFPMDYRISCRNRFNTISQGGKSVTEYAFEIEELVDLIGEVSEREKVIRLWNGFRSSIQSALWRDRLHPELATWDQVLDVALYVELSEKPMRRAEQSNSKSFESRKSNRFSRPSRVQANTPATHDKPSPQTSGPSSHRAPGPSKPQSSQFGKHSKKSPKPSSKLSKREEQELRAANKCFLCKETGHMKRNCPRANIVRTSGSSRPPGVSNFNVEFVDRDEEEDEVLEYLECGAMSFEAHNYDSDADSESDDYPRVSVLRAHPIRQPYRHIGQFRKPHLDLDRWPVYDRSRHPARHMGDAHVKVALNILNSSQPYPGDQSVMLKGSVLVGRFVVIKEYVDDYLIRDRLLDRYYTIERVELEDPDFTPGDWYARIRQIEEGHRAEDTPLNHRRMGDAVSKVAECILRDGIEWMYPSPRGSYISAEDRFRVRRHSTDFFMITDYVRRSSTKIEVACLTDHRFNLARWYELLLARKRRHGNREIPFEPEPDNRWSPLPFGGDSSDESDTRDEVSEGENEFYGEDYRSDDGSTPPSLPDLIDEEMDWSEEYNPPVRPVIRLGDPYCERLQEALKLGAPYPGERPLHELSQEEIVNLANRFVVRRAGRSRTILEIEDLVLKTIHYLPEEFARDPQSSPGRWYAQKIADKIHHGEAEFLAWSLTKVPSQLSMGPALEEALESRIKQGVPYRQDRLLTNPHDDRRFCVDPDHYGRKQSNIFLVLDRGLGVIKRLPVSFVSNPDFNPAEWYQSELEHHFSTTKIDYAPHPRMVVSPYFCAECQSTHIVSGPSHATDAVELAGIQVPRNSYKGVQRNAAWVKGTQRIVPKPIVVVVNINGHPSRALLDSGSLGDFISSTVVDQLKLKREKLDDPLNLQLAVQGLKSKITSRVTVKLAYQDIDEDRHFDVINVSNYDLILGTPFLYQHQVCVGLNPARVVIGSATSLPIQEDTTTRVVISGISMDDQAIEKARTKLKAMAEPLCRDLDQIPLPPLRVINHTIPLIDERKVYPWRPSRCPEVFRPQWAEKRDMYLKSGRWEITSAGNTVPMLLIPKPKKDRPELRTVIDLRERNKNTRKLTSPLPDIEGILRRLAKKPFRSSLDMKAAYEQIRVVPEHVPRTAMTTPDGNMVSHVVQQGDCNAPATYQALMNHLFSPYIGRFMDVYLDDIVIYSDTMEEHLEHVRLIFEILKRERLYLSKDKLRFLAKELDILGHIVDDHGIRMDPAKVDSVLAWKTPTNRDLLRGFLGSVGYLADDIPGVRIPMGVLSAITGDTVPFRWSFTEQRAFEDVKRAVHEAREHRRVPLDYSANAPPIWLVTDGCATGIAGVISQGDDWKTARVAAFYSAKLNDAQRNYPTHEVEMLAGVESMLRHADILQGAKFQWVTDHKGLVHLLDQDKLSGRKARWIEKISSFDFSVVYVPGTENVLADSLSRLYSNDSPGTVRSTSEYTYFDVSDSDSSDLVRNTAPVLTGLEALAAVVSNRKDRAKNGVLPPSRVSARIAARVQNALKESREQEGEGRSKSKNTSKKPKPEPSTVIAPEPVHAPITTQPRLTIKIPASKRDSAPVATVPEYTGPDVQLQPPKLGNALRNMLESTNGISLLEELRGKYQDDTTFSPIIDNPSQFRNFDIIDGLVYLKKDGKRLLCIPKVKIKGRNAREIVIDEAHSLLAHLGYNKTVGYLREHVWWKDLISDTKAFCDTCAVCKRSKPDNQKPYGLLNPLPVPTAPWEAIGVDFVGPLPLSSNRNGTYDSLTVVICLLTAMVHLIPCRTNQNAIQFAELMFDEIYKHHGIPRDIVSDRDTLFNSTFWQHLHKLLGTKLRMSSAYHPQTDGSTERANRTITQMLRQCINAKQDDWVQKLPSIEFAINSARSESTGYAPFFLNHGRLPRAMIWDTASPEEFPAVRRFAQMKKLALMEAHDSILAARVKQTREANRHRREAPFAEGDLVYLSTKNISFPKGLARKLVPKRGARPEVYPAGYRLVHEITNSRAWASHQSGTVIVDRHGGIRGQKEPLRIEFFFLDPATYGQPAEDPNSVDNNPALRRAVNFAMADAFVEKQEVRHGLQPTMTAPRYDVQPFLQPLAQSSASREFDLSHSNASNAERRIRNGKKQNISPPRYRHQGRQHLDTARGLPAHIGDLPHDPPLVEPLLGLPLAGIDLDHLSVDLDHLRQLKDHAHLRQLNNRVRLLQPTVDLGPFHQCTTLFPPLVPLPRQLLQTIRRRTEGELMVPASRVSLTDHRDAVANLPDSTWGAHLEPSGVEFFKAQRPSKRKRRAMRKAVAAAAALEQAGGVLVESDVEDDEDPSDVVDSAGEEAAVEMEKKYITYPEDEVPTDDRMVVDGSDGIVEAEDLEMGPR